MTDTERSLLLLIAAYVRDDIDRNDRTAVGRAKVTAIDDLMDKTRHDLERPDQTTEDSVR